MKKTKASLKKEMDDCFSEMEQLTKKAEYAMSIVKKYPGAEGVVGEAEELMNKWSEVAKRYVAVSKEYHNLTFGKTPI